MRQYFIDELVHGHRGVGDGPLNGARRNVADALGLVAVVPEGELVEISLQMLQLTE